MNEFIEKLKTLKETLTDEEKKCKLYFYVPETLKDEFGEENENLEYFYINDEKSHNDNTLTCEYPASDFIYKLLNLLDAEECAEVLYVYHGNENELIEKLNIINKELQNIILTKEPWQ